MTTWDPNNKDASITLSSDDLTATGSATSSWRSVIGTGPGKSTGKWYWRTKCTVGASSYATCAASNGILPSTNYIGSDNNGWIVYAATNSNAAYQHGGSVIGGSGPLFLSNGDFLLCALDGTNSKIYFTTMTAAGVLNTNWCGNSSNPATNTGGFSTAGATLMPAASFFSASGAGDQAVLDTTTVITDATLSGFQVYDTPSFVGVYYQTPRAWRHAISVIPSDNAVLPAATDYLSFVNSGSQTIRITTIGGETLTLPPLASNLQHPIRAVRVWATGTTVTNIVAYWT